MRLATFLPSVFLVIALLLGCACAPTSPQGGGEQSAAGNLPEITDDLIRERINWTWIRKVPAANGIDEPISWNFDENEPKEITVLEKQVNGDRATIVLDIKTTTQPRSRDPKYLTGQIRTEWELRSGWVLRQWEIADTENISVTYTKLPKPPPPENSNR